MCHKLKAKENVKCDTVAAALRRDVKARHGSARGERRNRTGPARDGSCDTDSSAPVEFFCSLLERRA